MSVVLPDPLRPSTTQRCSSDTVQLTSSRINRSSRRTETCSRARTSELGTGAPYRCFRRRQARPRTSTTVAEAADTTSTAWRM